MSSPGSPSASSRTPNTRVSTQDTDDDAQTVSPSLPDEDDRTLRQLRQDSVRQCLQLVLAQFPETGGFEVRMVNRRNKPPQQEIFLGIGAVWKCIRDGVGWVGGFEIENLRLHSQIFCCF